MDGNPLAALYLDSQHGDRHTSFILSKPVAPPTPSPNTADDTAELEALIEEARQRARGRRRRYVTAFALAGIIAAGVYFGLLRGDDATRSIFEAPESPASGGAIQSGVVKGSFDM